MHGLPTGTVTFLFTDIEGSTRLLERLGERYRNVQVRHDVILRAAIAEGKGREVSTEGDAFFAVFPTPTGAVRAVARAQRKLAAEQPGDGDVIRVRMGLHTGDGILAGDTYIGLDVNRTARIAAAAHGGQVLLSQATRGLVEGSLPTGLGLRDLGLHRLKDLAQPVHLHQLVIDGVEQDFPPLRTLDADVHNLPTQLTRFIGRDQEISSVREILAAHRLVTLTGPGGIGKTRLGLQVAAEALADFRDGAFFVDLSALISPELVASEIIGILRVRSEQGREVLDTLGDYLSEKELLLVLDNFEQVLDAGPSVLARLLRIAPAVKALATSRVPLRLYGERVYPVPSLSLPNMENLPKPENLVQFEAVALFVDRAVAAKPEFHVTSENARPVAEIVARLDGLPLAIELAASRVNLLSPEQLLARLERRLPMLTTQDRNVPERQRTLRQTIAWSYELLDEPERRMFSRLSVFAGGAELDATDVVVNPKGELGLDTLDGLASLVDKSLVRSVDIPQGEPRFVMLETIREYGLERLSESGDESTIRRRHAEHWAHVADEASEALQGPEQGLSIRQLELDHDNFRSALTWALQSGDAELGLRLGSALRDYWHLGGHLQEGRRWLEDLLALAGAAERTALRARALTAAADISSWTGEREAYFVRADEAVSIYRELGDQRGMADALEELGVALMQAGRFDVALADVQEAMDLQISLGNRQKAGECSMVLGMLAIADGHPDQARILIEAALTTFKDLGDPYWIAFAERLMGGFDRLDGRFDAAESRFRASLSAAREYELPIMATALYGFADLALGRGQHARALRIAGASEAVSERFGEDRSFEMALVGDVREAAGSFFTAAAAQSLYEEGRAMELDDAVAYALRPEET